MYENSFTDGREPDEARDAVDTSSSLRCPNSPQRRKGASPSQSPPGSPCPRTRNESRRGRGRGCRGRRSPATPPRNGNYSRNKNAPPSPPHDAPMTKKDIYFALDCEMVGTGPEGLDSALARVTIVNYDEDVVLDKYVKVPVPVTDYRTFVSGITREDIESSEAITWEECRNVVRKMLHGKILIGHGLEGDLKALGITHPWTDVRDTASYAPYMREASSSSPSSLSSSSTSENGSSNSKPVLLPRKLRDLAWEELGEQIQILGEAHSPIEDAVSALRLYKRARTDWEREMAAAARRQLERQQRIEREQMEVQQANMMMQQQQQQQANCMIPASGPGYPPMDRQYSSSTRACPPILPAPQSSQHMMHTTKRRHPVKKPYLPSPPRMGGMGGSGNPQQVHPFRPVPSYPHQGMNMNPHRQRTNMNFYGMYQPQPQAQQAMMACPTHV